MPGETDLQKLLKNMRPELRDGEYVFCTFPDGNAPRFDLDPLGCFRETEGWTLILERSVAEQAGVSYGFVARLITLTIHSSLEAVGFLDVITQKLAAAGISTNVISAYYHDHLFVPVDKTEQALQLLLEMTT
jgi:hypothetical protein